MVSEPIGSAAAVMFEEDIDGGREEVPGAAIEDEEENNKGSKFGGFDEGMVQALLHISTTYSLQLFLSLYQVFLWHMKVIF